MSKRETKYQNTLFDLPAPVETKEALVLSMPIAAANMRNGINQAIDTAEKEVDPEWSNKAYEFLLKFLNNHNGHFMVEEVRSYAALLDFDLPPSNRAWGGIILRAKKAGIIENCGYNKTRNVKAHCTPAAVWRQVKPINAI